MPIYTNNDLEMIIPQRHVTGERPEISEDQAREWWNALSNGVLNDPDVGVRLSEGHNLYYFTDEGTIVRAVNEGDSLSDPEFLIGLMEKSMDGRLFTQLSQGGQPRQVITNPDADFEVGIADKKPVDAVFDEDLLGWLIPKGEVEEPKGPFFLKILAYPFSKSIREEFQTYWKAKEEYQAQCEEDKWRERFKPDAVQDNIVAEDLEETVRAAEEEQERKEREFQEAEKRRIQDEQQREKEEYFKKRDERKAEWDKDVSQMTLKQFDEYTDKLMDEHQYSDFRNIHAVIESKHSTVDDLYDAMARFVVSGMWSQLHDVGNIMGMTWEGKNYWIASQLKPFQDAKAGLREFLETKVDKNLVKRVSESHEFGNDYKKLTDQLKTVGNNIYNDYYFKKHGLALNSWNVPAEPLKNALLLKYKAEGPGSMQKIADLYAKLTETKPDASWLPQKQPQQVQQTQQVQQPAAPSKGGAPSV